MPEFPTTARHSLPGTTRRTHRIFLTGATGVVGRRLLPRLVEAGHQVTAVGRSPDKRAALVAAGARAVEVDLLSARSVERALGDSDVIVNLATAVPRSWLMLWPQAWHPMDRVRREASATIVEVARRRGGVERFIQESFAAIYAEGGDRWLNEESPLRPANYNRSVLDAEGNARRMTRSGTEVVVLRFGFFYGPDDGNTLQFLRTLRRGWYALPGAREGYTSWVSHADAADAVLAALEVPGGIYNVVDDEPMTRGALADGLTRVMGRSAPRFLPAWMARHSGPVGETIARSLRIANRKLRAVSGWSPADRSALEGMSRIVESRFGD